MSTTFKRILVPIDFSEHSLHALEFADAMAKQFGGALHLVHVMEQTPYDFYAASGIVPAMPMPLLDPEVIKAELQKQLDKLAGPDRGGPCTSEVRYGHAVDEILAAGKDHGCDLLVICTHGRTGLSHLVMGSVAEKLVRLAAMPVLSVRAEGLAD